MDYERLFLDNLDLVDQVVRGLVRRHRLSPDEIEDLRGAVRLKLIDKQYDVLRRFQQRCSLRTYLTTVVHRVYLDERAARWGKWRPSVAAKRRGPTAVLLERLLNRDGLGFDQAAEIMRTNHQVDESVASLYQLSAELPVRTPRRFVDDAVLGDATAGDRADGRVVDREQAARAKAMAFALATALRGLGAQDRLILKMRFTDGFQVSEIGRVLRLDSKRLYRQLEHVMKALRQALEEHGFSQEDVAAIAGSPAADFGGANEDDNTGNVPARPSVL